MHTDEGGSSRITWLAKPSRCPHGRIFPRHYRSITEHDTRSVNAIDSGPPKGGRAKPASLVAASTPRCPSAADDCNVSSVPFLQAHRLSPPFLEPTFSTLLSTFEKEISIQHKSHHLQCCPHIGLTAHTSSHIHNSNHPFPSRR